MILILLGNPRRDELQWPSHHDWRKHEGHRNGIGYVCNSDAGIWERELAHIQMIFLPKMPTKDSVCGSQLVTRLVGFTVASDIRALKIGYHNYSVDWNELAE